MTKGLEALRDILGILSAVSGCEVDMNSELIQTITKELKALEILKKKEVNVNTLINIIVGAIDPLEFYNEKVSTNLKLTQEEFNSLKEVLKNE